MPELRNMLLHTWQAGWEARWALSCSGWLKPLLRTINNTLSVLSIKCGVQAINNTVTNVQTYQILTNFPIEFFSFS
jgi:hypothetical protein